MSKIALHMIVAGHEDPKSVIRCIDSIKKQVDGIYITITTKMKDKTLKKKLEKYGVVDYEPDKFFHIVPEKQLKWLKKFGIKPVSKLGDKVFRFDIARNHNMAQVPKEFKWMIWLDSDDIWRGDRLRDVVKLAEQTNVDSVFFNYIYQADIKDGKVRNILIEHLRERLFRNDGSYKWVAPIHETVIEQRPTRKTENDWCDVLHLSDTKKMLSVVDRNIKSLEYSIWDKKGKDPRPNYYLAKAYFDLYMQRNDKNYLERALPLFNKYLAGKHQSGWKEERAQCWEYITEIYRVLGKIDEAIIASHRALVEDERFPSIYLNIALSYIHKKEYERALHWVKIAAKLEVPKSTLVINPRDLKARALEIIYHASLKTNKIDEAWAASKKLLELLPDDRVMIDRYEFMNNLRKQRDITQDFIKLAQFLEKAGEGPKLIPLLNAVPSFIEKTPFIIDLKNKLLPPKKWGKKEVAIHIGPCFTPWSPKTIKNPGDSFIGGSEEAVIYLSQELTKQGWKVTVYGDPGSEEGKHDGVTYLPYYKLNERDEFNIFVAWRRPDLADRDLKCKKFYVWCHDIQNPADYPKERLKKIHKIIVLSDWHRTNIPEVPNYKILISSNGIKL